MEVKKDEFYAYLNSKVGIGISDSSLLFDDLGIDGLDAELLMQGVADKFHVNMEGYDPYKYHFMESEVANPIKVVWSLLFRKRKIKCFTALHLYNVVLSGKWFEPSSP